MNDPIRISLILPVFLALLGLLPMGAEAATLEVPGQFPTIQSAVNAASDGDTVIVQPGTYYEAVSTVGKTITLAGVDKGSCILQYSAANYELPPLQMSSGTLKNMTVRAVGSRRRAGYGAYCLHADNDFMEGRVLMVEDCDFINEGYEAVGVGLHPRSTVHFVRCMIESLGQYSALFAHDYESERADIQGQNLVLEGCTLVSNSLTNPSFILQSQGITVPVAQATFVNNTLVNRAGGELFLMRTFIVYPAFLQEGQVVVLPRTDWTLNPISSGNNVAPMNAVQVPPLNTSGLNDGIAGIGGRAAQ